MMRRPGLPATVRVEGAGGLVSALQDAIMPQIAERANTIAKQVVVDGVAVAARYLSDAFK
jgi:hypothetical protein